MKYNQNNFFLILQLFLHMIYTMFHYKIVVEIISCNCNIVWNLFWKSLTFMHIISHIILTNDGVKLSNTNWSRCELLKLYVFADFAFTFTSQCCLRLIRSTIISLTTLDCYSQKIEKRRFAELMWLWGIHTLIYISVKR